MYGERLVVTGTTDETGPLIAYLRPVMKPTAPGSA
jgi:hypothetical protein